MHEISICENLVRLLEAEAGRQGFSKISRIWLEIGPLAAIDAATLEFNFRNAASGSLADGAMLSVTEVADGGQILIKAIEGG